MDDSGVPRLFGQEVIPDPCPLGPQGGSATTTQNQARTYLNDLANFLAQSQHGASAGVPGVSEVAALQTLLENVRKAGLSSVPGQSLQPPIVEQAWPCPSAQRLVPPEVTGPFGGLQAEVPPNIQLAKLAEFFRLLEEQEQAHAMMSDSSWTCEQQTVLSRWLQESRTQLQQLRQMQQLQQMQRQMQELQPKLQQMQEMVNRFMTAAYMAQQQVPQMQTPSFTSLPSHHAPPAPGLDWPGQSDANSFPVTLESLANYGQMGMPAGSVAAGSHHSGHDKVGRVQNRTNHIRIKNTQRAGGWMNVEPEEATQSSSPPSSSTDRDKKSTLGMHLTQLQTEDPRCVFITRRINGMGFQSKDILSAFYGQYGKVVKVLVAHSKVKPFRRQGAQSRIRPGSLGFVVMDSPEAVEKILEVGTTQKVAGHMISVEPFERIAKPQDPGQSADSTATNGDSTTTGSGSGSGGSGSDKSSTGSANGLGDSNGSDKSSAGSANGLGESGSGGSEEGSDKGNGFSADGSQPKAEGSQGSSEDSNPGDGDSQSEASNRATSPGTGRKKEAFEEGVLPGESEKAESG
ncbi:unnamed protein product [Symbiodinium natans]|uniref:RRM domain-containing protein n=1 Tax=Symbiodinium natans TaxID=878477 RepID=A0A812I5I7_9DINO|nr:unnamed protein product [Symbiodinium natans]